MVDLSSNPFERNLLNIIRSAQLRAIGEDASTAKTCFFLVRTIRTHAESFGAFNYCLKSQHPRLVAGPNYIN